MGLDLIVSTPLPAGTVLTLDTLDEQGNPVPLERIELDRSDASVQFENVGDLTIDLVLSLVIDQGDNGAFTSHPFFQPGSQYVENRPVAAPETLRSFRVSCTDRHPRTGGLVAFGFGTGGEWGVQWHRASLDADDWADGKWVLKDPDPDVSPELAVQVAEGIAEAEAGQTAYLGDFGRYLPETEGE